ncbi:MAG TPA: alpha/beta fold hydrolase [Stellaceae bacterium]|nr:alpha/beta fold hydrolase [Stellaceae bacterium]
MHETFSHDPAALLERLSAAAMGQVSPCGEGEMVWRQWGAGPALVLLHGGYGSWTHWVKNIEPLAERYRVIAADMPGLGDSAMPPQPITPERLAAIIDRGLDAVLAPGERFHLVGFSFGAMLGSFLALRRGAAVRSLVLVGSASMGLRRAPMREMQSMRRHMSEAELAGLQRANLAVLMFADERRIDDLAVRLQVENVARARVKSRRFAPIDLLRPILPQVMAPLGGIWGERDATAYPYVEERRDLLRAIQPHAPFDIIAGAGHWVMYEAAQAFNRALLAQLAATERAEAVRA